MLINSYEELSNFSTIAPGSLPFARRGNCWRAQAWQGGLVASLVDIPESGRGRKLVVEKKEIR